MGKQTRIGLLTGGGDCPGLNAVIRAVVKAGVTGSGFEVIGIRDSFNGLLTTPSLSSGRHPRPGPHDVETLTRDSVRGILTKGGTILGTTNRGDPFAFPTKQADGSMAFPDRSGELLESMRILELDGLVVVGGDGTLRISKKLMDAGARIIGVPKTIDNDIAATDVTFGFNTAVEIATEAIDRLHSTAESHDRVMVVEVMGRNAGWIAVHAGLSGGADAILIPEIPYDIQKVCDKVRRRQAAGRFFSIVVVAEGAFPSGGRQALIDPAPAGGMPRLGGAGAIAAEGITVGTGLETRVTVLGHLLRGGTPSSYDRLLATRFGSAAVELVEQGRWGRMVALQGTVITSVPIGDAISQQKRVDPEGELIATGRRLGVEFG